MSQNLVQYLIYAAIVSIPLLIQFIPQKLQVICIALFGTLTPLLTLEVALRLGFRADDLNWTPPEAFEVNDAINAQHSAVAARHPYGFNDTTINPDKPKGTYRLAILGDSFVWGDGVTDSDRWTKKLEQRLKIKNSNLQVLHWGQCGWSTAAEVRFLKAHAAEWNLDQLIISFVANDPDVQRVPQKHFLWNTYRFPRLVAYAFPYGARFIFGYLSEFLNERVPGWGYDYWERELYTQENLAAYRSVLTDLKQTAESLRVPTTIFLLPSSWHPYFKEQFDKLAPLLDEIGLKYVSLYPQIYSRLSNVPLAKLRANRANGHPGPLITEAYADLVYESMNNDSINREALR